MDKKDDEIFFSQIKNISPQVAIKHGETILQIKDSVGLMLVPVKVNYKKYDFVFELVQVYFVYQIHLRKY